MSEIKENFKSLASLNSSIVFFISAKKLNRNINIIKEFFLKEILLFVKKLPNIMKSFLDTKF